MRLRRDGKECRLRSSKVCLAGSFEEVDHLRTVMPILTMIGSVQQALQFLVFWPAIPAISRKRHRMVYLMCVKKVNVIVYISISLSQCVCTAARAALTKRTIGNIKSMKVPNGLLILISACLYRSARSCASHILRCGAV